MAERRHRKGYEGERTGRVMHSRITERGVQKEKKYYKGRNMKI